VRREDKVDLNLGVVAWWDRSTRFIKTKGQI
jgi:hypothetical protein